MRDTTAPIPRLLAVEDDPVFACHLVEHLQSIGYSVSLCAINAKWGRNTLRPGRVTTAPDWGMRREMMSQSFTTGLDQLWVVRCN